MGALLYIVALVAFILAGLGVEILNASGLELVAWGLAFFVAGHLVGGGFGGWSLPSRKAE